MRRFNYYRCPLAATMSNYFACVCLPINFVAWNLIWTVSTEKEEGSDSNEFVMKDAFLICLLFRCAVAGESKKVYAFDWTCPILTFFYQSTKIKMLNVNSAAGE